MSSFRQEEAASWTDIIKEEQLLLLIRKQMKKRIKHTKHYIFHNIVHFSRMNLADASMVSLLHVFLLVLPSLSFSRPRKRNSQNPLHPRHLGIGRQSHRRNLQHQRVVKWLKCRMGRSLGPWGFCIDSLAMPWKSAGSLCEGGVDRSSHLHTRHTYTHTQIKS